MTRTGRYRGRCEIGAQALTAVLVESVRVNGSPRQRFVAHLGTVRVWENGRGQVAIGTGRASPSDVRGFWGRVSVRLDAVQSPLDRDAVERMVAMTVPRPAEFERVTPPRARRAGPAAAC